MSAQRTRSALPVGRRRREAQNADRLAGWIACKFEVRQIDETIGAGVFVVRPIAAGEYVMNYSGEIVSEKEARAREHRRRARGDRHFYTIWPRYKKLVIDPTDDKDGKEYGVARFINHSRLRPNLSMTSIKRRGKDVKIPIQVQFHALRDIAVGEELFYDYGGRNEPWLRET